MKDILLFWVELIGILLKLIINIYWKQWLWVFLIPTKKYQTVLDCVISQNSTDKIQILTARGT